jgi:ABC-type branched-subunit amino acid transport system substrate-binding protein
MRKLLAPAVVLGLLMGAAGVASAAGSSAPGVTKDEIKVGITYVDLDAVRSVTNIDHGDYEKTYNAVIDDLNRRGGVNGRELVPVFAKINPLGTVPAQEACVKLTEDEKVFAAMGFFLNDAPLCFVDQHDTPVLGGTTTPQYLSRAKAPWFTPEAGAEVASRVIDTLATSGALKGKLGIVTLAADEQSLLHDVVLPALKRNKIKGTSAILDASTTDTVAVTQQAGTFAERFKSDGVKTVLLVGNSPSAFMNALSKTDYRPRLVATSINPFQAAAINPATDPSELKGAVSASVGTKFDDPSLQKCFRVVEQVTSDKVVENAPAGEPDYRASAEAACRYVALFATLAGAAGKNLTVQSFGQAPAKLGSFELPGSGKVTYDPKTHTFVQPMFTYRYEPSLQRMVVDKEVS